MSLKDQITAHMVAAMKAKEALALGTLRMLKAEIMKYEVSGVGKVATDEVVLQLIQRAIKQRKEAIEGFNKGGNREEAEKEAQEMVFLERYLPEPMREGELRSIVSQMIQEMNAGPQDFGKVMGAVMAKVKGRVEGTQVSQAVKESLENL